jgi:hypothetical protein
MTKTLDFVLLAGNCPQSGCEEYSYNHRINFETKQEKERYKKVLDTINKYGDLREIEILKDCFCQTDSEVDDILKKVREYYPLAFALTTIFSCKHGWILYQTSIRLPDIDETEEQILAKNLRKCLPERIEEEKGRSIESMFVDVEYL